MQLIFSVDEFITLIHIMRELEADIQIQQPLRDSSLPILQKLLNHDFGFAIDELEDLGEILREYSGKLRKKMSARSPGENRAELVQLQRTLEHIMEKVSEACAMV